MSLAARAPSWFARLLHRLHRSAALRLVRRGTPRQVLFVCYGNLCRSPFAAARFAQRSNVPVRSAGFAGSGHSPPTHAIRVADRHGVDLSGHRSTLITLQGVVEADLVVVMDPGQRVLLETLFGRDGRPVVVLGDLDPAPGADRTIADPMNQPESAFEESYARIERCVDALVGALAVGRPVAGSP